MLFLFVKPSGTGKSLLAKACTGEFPHNIFLLEADQILSKSIQEAKQ